MNLRRPNSLLFWVFLCVCFSALFSPGLFQNRIPAFRDAYHFYYPQLKWLDDCADQGEWFPTWRTDDALGVDAPGETTTALFYPLRVIWLMPWFSLEQRFSLFIIAHLLIAAAGMTYLCKRWDLRKEAGWLAAVSYSLSCPLLFQQYNLVYLCSAAWLGFAIAEFGLMFRENVSPKLFVVSVTLAMMILGGDPHTAVNLLLIFSVGAVYQAIYVRNFSLLMHHTGRLAQIAALTLGLAMIQILPSCLWSSQSERFVDYSNTQQVTTTASNASLGHDQLAPELAWLINESSPKLNRDIYSYSEPPWHLVTTVWSTLGGNFIPTNSRVFELLPGEGLMWQPSWYFGFLPLLLAGNALIFGKSNAHAWLRFLIIFATIASLGNYSLGWFLRLLLNSFDGSGLANQLPQDHVLSLYGLMAEYLPGYNVFRFPAKWNPIAIALLVALAAVEFQSTSLRTWINLTKPRRILAAVSSIALLLCCAMICATWINPSFASWLESQIPATAEDRMLGVPEVSAMLHTATFAFAVPIAVLILLQFIAYRQSNLGRTILPLAQLLVWITLLESFIVATQWCVFCDPPRANTASLVASNSFSWADTSAVDIVKDRFLESEPDQLQRVTRYQEQFVIGKLSSISAQKNLSAEISIEPALLTRIRSRLASQDNLTDDQPSLDSALAFLGVTERLVREHSANGFATFNWQTVPNAKPACEVLDLSGKPLSNAKLSFHWQKSGELRVQCELSEPGIIVVRQWNDRRWLAIESTQDGDLPLKLQSFSTIFVAWKAEAGSRDFLLRRPIWPTQFGGLISALTALIGLLASLRKKSSPT